MTFASAAKETPPEKFFRPWYSQFQGSNGKWVRLDWRGKMIDRSHEARDDPWPGLPLSSDKRADGWRGLHRNNLQVIEHIGFEVGTYERLERIRVYTPTETMDFISKGIINRREVRISTICLYEDPKFVPGESVICVGAYSGTAIWFLLFEHIKRILDKPEYADYRFCQIRDFHFKYIQTKYPPGPRSQ